MSVVHFDQAHQEGGLGG